MTKDLIIGTLIFLIGIGVQLIEINVYTDEIITYLAVFYVPLYLSGLIFPFIKDFVKNRNK